MPLWFAIENYGCEIRHGNSIDRTPNDILFISIVICSVCGHRLNICVNMLHSLHLKLKWPWLDLGNMSFRQLQNNDNENFSLFLLFIWSGIFLETHDFHRFIVVWYKSYSHVLGVMFYIPLMSMASQRQTCPNAPSPRILKNFKRCLGKSQRSDFPCEFELLVDSCDVVWNYIYTELEWRKKTHTHPYKNVQGKNDSSEETPHTI